MDNGKRITEPNETCEVCGATDVPCEDIDWIDHTERMCMECYDAKIASGEY